MWIYTGVMMASLPPAATIYVIATQYNTYLLRGSSAILLGTTTPVLTVTGVLYLISNNLLPLDLFAQGYLMRPIFHSSVEPFPTVNAQ